MDKQRIRLHILDRPHTHKALVMRRGPTNVVGFFAFDFKTNKIQEGQWLKGRIYERKSDLSPDGQHLIYFAGKSSVQYGYYTYTVVSRFPRMTALDMYEEQGTWGGGGMFIDSKTYWLSDASAKCLRKSSALRFENTVATRNQNIYNMRLFRNGWRQVEGGSFVKEFAGFRIEKQQLYAHGHRDLNKLFNATNQCLLEVTDDYMDFRAGKLYYTNQSKLMVADLSKSDLEREKILADFTQFSFRAIK